MIIFKLDGHKTGVVRSYLHARCCFIVHDLPPFKNSVCSSVCVGLVGDPGWTNIVIQSL